MPVSYVSEIIKSNPWIQPFDIGLMTKVNGYLQGQFYANAVKIENQISQLNNADIANPQQREYLKAKVNNLTTQIGNMGALNYADVNVANTLEGYSTEIYSDEKVINGIASTKKIRQYQANMEKMKTDPKLSKYYSPSFEAYDYEHYVKPYVQGGLDASYEGGSAPDPYDSEALKKLNIEIDRLKADYTETVDPITGLRMYVSVNGKESLTGDRIVSMALLNIDGKLKNQFQKDAWYNFIHTPGGTFGTDHAVNHFTKQEDKRLAMFKDQKESLEQALQNPTLTDDDRKMYKEKLKEYEGKLDNSKEIDRFRKTWEKNQEAGAYELYTRDMLQDLVNARSYSKSTIKLHRDLGAIHDAKKELAMLRAGKTKQLNADGTSNFVSLLTTSDVENLDKKEVTEQTIVDKNTALYNEMNTGVINMISETALLNQVDLNGDISYSDNANDKAIRTNSNLLERIANATGDARFTKQDLEYTLNNQGAKNVVSLNNKELTFFQNILTAWDQAADGKNITADLVGKKKWGEFIEKYNTTQNRIQLNNNLIAKAETQAKNELFVKKDFSASDRELYDQYLKDPESYATYRTVTEDKMTFQEFAGYTNPRIGTLLNKVSPNEYRKRKKEFIGTLANQRNFYGKNLKDSDKALNENLDGIRNMISNTAGFNPNIKRDDIQPSVVYGDDNGNYFVKYYDKSKTINKAEFTVPVEQQNLKYFELEALPDPNLEEVVRTNGRLYTPINFYVANNNINQPVKVQIHSNTDQSGRNNYKFQAFILYNDEQIPYVSVDQNGNLNPPPKSANAALVDLKATINNFASSKRTFPEIIEAIKNINKRFL